MLPEALDAIVGFRGGSSMKLDRQKALRRDLLRGAFTVCSASLQLIVMKFVFVRLEASTECEAISHLHG